MPNAPLSILVCVYHFGNRYKKKTELNPLSLLCVRVALFLVDQAGTRARPTTGAAPSSASPPRRTRAAVPAPWATTCAQTACPARVRVVSPPPCHAASMREQ